VSAVEIAGPRFRLTTGLLGLTGPNGVLPRPFTELVNTERRHRSPAFAAFLDLLAQRPLANFAMAGIKYRPHRAGLAVNGMQSMALALSGYATPRSAERLPTGTGPMMFYSGLFSAYPRSASRLGALLTDWLGRPVEVEEFDGTWLQLPPHERSALPSRKRAGRFNALGVDAAIGSRSWDLQSRIRLRIGPLSLEQFDALMPDRLLFHRLAGLVRAYLGGETRFALNPILAVAEVPKPTVRRGARAALGWNAWLPTSGGRRHDGTEAVFEADGIALAEPAAAGRKKTRRNCR